MSYYTVSWLTAVIPTILLLRLKSCYNIIKSKIIHVESLKILKLRTLRRNFANFHKKLKILFLESKPSMICKAFFTLKLEMVVVQKVK